MFQAAVDINLCYGHRLVGHEGGCRFLHGHSGLLTLRFASPTLKEGREDMVIDFGYARRQARKWVDEVLDHTMLLHKDDPLVDLLARAGERFLALDQRPTAEVIARYTYEHLRVLGLPVTQVCLCETKYARATYSPEVSDEW